MTDQTPSPQSVVVPRDLVARLVAMYEDYRKSDLNHACAHSAFVGWQEKHDDWKALSSALAAAPAPSSLAGGERETIARIIDPETFALIAHYTGIDRFDDLSPAEREPAVFKGSPDLKRARDAAYADADRILAALSPEAPAREGVA